MNQFQTLQQRSRLKAWAVCVVFWNWQVVEDLRITNDDIFTSENQVQGYFAKGNSLTYHNGLTNGSYSVSGSNVTFNNFDISLNSRMIKII